MRKKNMPEPIVLFDSVFYTYPGTDSPALSDISLEIMPGEYVGVIGLNGAGKTTLGLSLNGVVPNMLGGHREGTVMVGGLDVEEYPVREMAKIVGIVFDNPEFQMSQMTCAEEVALGLESSGMDYATMRRSVAEALSLVGLEGFEERSPLGLSGGQQQRLAIAAVLAMKPQVLIMDEPTSNLDPIGKQEVFGMATTLNQKYGMTVIVMEHEVEVLAEFADRIIVMDGGRVVMNGAPREIFSRVDELQALGLRVPEATALANLLGKTGHWKGGVPINTAEAARSVNELLGVKA
jgi:energy-coupling factor transport system ATP-binding protein